MKLGLRFFIFLSIGFLFLTNISHSFADNSFITIVNPVRISDYNKDPVASLKAESDQIKSRNFPATWLLTYDVISNSKLADVFKQMDSSQEIGIFLEVTPNFAKSSNVSYNNTNSWHRATSLFLSGYSVGDRIKLIDTVFQKFKKTFGYYPKSVGAWWVDAYSLDYMKNNYGITGVLGVSDQYDLDGYQVWGTPWSTPFYPNKINAAIPAGSTENKIGVVTFRWAARDPLNGYSNSHAVAPSLYSTQDYGRENLDISYFTNLAKIYSTPTQFNKFGQITLGLEADYLPDTYSQTYSDQLDVISDLQNSGSTVDNMKGFSSWYLKQFPNTTPARLIESDDLLGTNKKSIWFQNSKYRIGFIYNKEDETLRVIDFRIYTQNFAEPFFKSPNKQYNLSINLPFIVDSVISPQNVWKFKAKNFNISDDSSSLAFDKGNILLGDSSIKIAGVNVPEFVKNSDQINFQRSNGEIIITPKQKYKIGENGILFNDYSFHVPFTISSKIQKYKIPVIILSLAVFCIFVFLSKLILKNNSNKFFLLVLLLFIILFFIFQIFTKYYISQTEMDGLSVLARLSPGNVLVYDKDCLKCSFATVKPAAAAGKKGYVEKYSGKKVTGDLLFETAPNSIIARQILENENIKYVYLAKYEDYIESLPYLPQDLGLKRVYENANVEIWKTR